MFVYSGAFAEAVQKYENMSTLPTSSILLLGRRTCYRFAPIFCMFIFLFIFSTDLPSVISSERSESRNLWN